MSQVQHRNDPRPVPTIRAGACHPARSPRTGHVGEEQDALVKAELEEPIPELLQDGHADTEREARVLQQQGVPQVEDLVQREHVCGGRAEPVTRGITET